MLTLLSPSLPQYGIPTHTSTPTPPPPPAVPTPCVTFLVRPLLERERAPWMVHALRRAPLGGADSGDCARGIASLATACHRSSGLGRRIDGNECVASATDSALVGQFSAMVLRLRPGAFVAPCLQDRISRVQSLVAGVPSVGFPQVGEKSFDALDTNMILWLVRLPVCLLSGLLSPQCWTRRLPLMFVRAVRQTNLMSSSSAARPATAAHTARGQGGIQILGMVTGGVALARQEGSGCLAIAGT